MKYVLLLFALHRWENYRTERLNNLLLLKVRKLRARIQMQVG